MSLPLVDLSLYLFTIINRNHEHNSFPEFRESSQEINELEGGLGETATCLRAVSVGNLIMTSLLHTTNVSPRMWV